MHRVGFVLLPHFSHLGVSAAIEPLFVANWLSQREAFGWAIASVDGKNVPASNGIVVTVAGDLRALDPCGTVFVLASFDWHEAARDRLLLDWLRRRARFGTEIGGIENGTFALAEAGLLDGHRVALHWDNVLGFGERYPAVRAVAAPHARDGAVLTCAGAAAILDMMIAWIGAREGSRLAEDVAAHLLTSDTAGGSAWSSGSAAQPDDPLVERVVAMMSATVDDPIACPEIARRVGFSLRHLERRFAAATGCSLRRKYVLVRLEKAHQLLQQTSLAVSDVAFSCGFSSCEHFSRLYRRVFGCSPSRDRRQVAAAAVMRGQYVPAHGAGR